MTAVPVVAGLVTLAAGLIVAPATAAHARTTAAAPRSATAVRVRLRPATVVRAVPATGGMTITLNDGNTYPVTTTQYRAIEAASRRSRPEDTVRGDCGESEIEIENLGGGRAEFSVSVESYVGNIDFGAASVAWNNSTTGASGTLYQSITANNGPTGWAGFPQDDTGYGTVSATLSGFVFVGIEPCVIGNPRETGVIN